MTPAHRRHKVLAERKLLLRSRSRLMRVAVGENGSRIKEGFDDSNEDLNCKQDERDFHDCDDRIRLEQRLSDSMDSKQCSTDDSTSQITSNNISLAAGTCKAVNCRTERRRGRQSKGRRRRDLHEHQYQQVDIGTMIIDTATTTIKAASTATTTITTAATAAAGNIETDRVDYHRQQHQDRQQQQQHRRWLIPVLSHLCSSSSSKPIKSISMCQRVKAKDKALQMYLKTTGWSKASSAGVQQILTCVVTCLTLLLISHLPFAPHHQQQLVVGVSGARPASNNGLQTYSIPSITTDLQRRTGGSSAAAASSHSDPHHLSSSSTNERQQLQLLRSAANVELSRRGERVQRETMSPLMTSSTSSTDMPASAASPAATCGYPGSPAHASVSFNTTHVVAGTAASYTCHNGYELLGPPRRICQPNGTWSPIGIPFCGK